MLVVALLCVLGVGLLLVPAAARAVRAAANLERTRLTRLGRDLPEPGPLPAGRRRALLTDSTLHREVGWLVLHASLGLVLGVFGVALPALALRDLTFPLWGWLGPPDATATSIGLGTAQQWPWLVAAAVLGLGWVAVLLFLTPTLARLQAWPGQRLLVPDADTDLSLRVVELTATRAAALDAHAAELRRIERALHDGTQNRLVAVTVLTGAARRVVARDPATAGELLERVQEAAEQALADLRTVIRGILPPVLADRGLAGALTGLAAASPVPCHIAVDLPARCPASVEATAYFVVAEALTNVARHSSATSCAVTATTQPGRLHLEVSDDGTGGAEHVTHGSGLAGIRSRVAAHDGTLRLSSPAGGPTVLQVELPCG